MPCVAVEAFANSANALAAGAQGFSGGAKSVF